MCLEGSHSGGVYGDYRTDVDKNMMRVVRILNEDLGLTTYASCDGNHSPYEVKNKKGITITKFHQSSYIAMDIHDIYKFFKLENYCKLHGFKKYLENQNRFEYHEFYYKNFNNGRLCFNFLQHKNRSDGKRFGVYIYPYRFTLDNLKTITHSNRECLRECDYEIPFELKKWNKIRNRGWRIALNIIKSALE